MGLLHVAMVLSQELNLIAEINICGSYEILPNCCRGELIYEIFKDSDNCIQYMP